MSVITNVNEIFLGQKLLVFTFMNEASSEKLPLPNNYDNLWN